MTAHTATFPPAKPKNIIVEGPDGSGKTTLTHHLIDRLGYKLHPRASDSVGGPVPELAQWVTDDLANQFTVPIPPWVYDRYPTISEPIYGPIVRGVTIPPFSNFYYLKGINDQLYTSTIVIWCLPPFNKVYDNVTNGVPQMAGVTGGIEKVHRAYQTAYFRWRGPKRLYDYTTTDLPAFLKELEGMLAK